MGVKLTVNPEGSFKIDNIDELSYTYFPLCNEHGLKASITPSLNGSLNIDQNTFFLLPTSNEDSHNSLMNRNVYLNVNDAFIWSITGNTPHQMIHQDQVKLEGDFLIHKITRQNELFESSIESFISSKDNIEYHKFRVTNNNNQSLTIKPVLNVPMYNRSADNIRDHRHVSSLFNRATLHPTGMTNQPTFLFDEEGHHKADHRYDIQFFTTSTSVKNYWPILEEFIGEGYNLLSPNVVTNNNVSSYKSDDTVTGYELTGGFEFEPITLKKNDTFELIFALGINSQLNQKPLSQEAYDEHKAATLEYWQELVQQLTCDMKDNNYTAWLKWVTIQPTLRRLYGNSFLPHHDYGKGGRGWRDLWQDQLSLILMDSTTVREALINNFKGVRIDGSNATIIGDRLGEFKSDRNNISRVWMDHGAWPLLTTQLYIDKTGDIDLLFEIVSYFEDQFTHYTKQTRKEWTPTHYAGTILEHLLVENIIPFFNVGEHNNLRLEDADWNDGLDMAKERGESVAFTAFYGNNLVKLGKILMTLYKKGYHTVKLLEQLNTLLKTIDYNNISLKQKMLDTYFDAINTKKLNTQPYECLALSKKLTELGTYLLQQVRENEWLEKEEDGWFNGYYDNNGNRLDNVIDKDMTLTPQVFTIMSSAATDKQVEKIIASADRYLFDITVGGYRLNTPFNEIKTNMGRLFGFGYGHKENGAMFTHMAMMYAYALYHRGYVKEGHKVFTTIYEYVSDIEKAKIYPGLPEYVDPMGRGMYTYLTGSASWYLLTLVTQVFGIQGQWGNILLNPKLVKSDFHHTKASIKTMVNNRSITFEYINTEDLDYEDYIITKVMADNQSIPFEESTEGVIINGQLTVDKLIIYLNRKA